MKFWVALCAGTALIVTSGCGTIRDQVRYPGGAPGRLLDKRTFDASHSKQLALMRMTLALAIAARIGEGSVPTQDADVFAKQLAEAAREINYAAVDAGFRIESATTLKTCAIKPGSLRERTDTAVEATSYREEDAKCAGYYVNFEANIARIESRIVRAMLTSLPTDHARKFIQDLAQGNLMSALWSLARSMGDVAGAFHRGAGAYRAGLENLAASVPVSCKGPFNFAFKGSASYQQEYDTVRFAAACLGLSEAELFDDTMIGPQDLPNRLDPQAFMALFRIVRTSCVALPLRSLPANPEMEQKDREARKEACDMLYFEPAKRADSILLTPQPPGTTTPAPEPSVSPPDPP